MFKLSFFYIGFNFTHNFSWNIHKIKQKTMQQIQKESARIIYKKPTRRRRRNEKQIN